MEIVIRGVYSGSGKAFDGDFFWHFDNGFATNIVIFGIGKSSSSDIL